MEPPKNIEHETSQTRSAVQVGDFFAVSPKYDCPHIEEHANSNISLYQNISITHKCEDCDNQQENWVCLNCQTVRCSRYVNEHMLMHAVLSEHGIALSFSDLSFWCYKCDSYIVHNDLRGILKHFQDKKFPPDVNSLSRNLQEMTIKEEEDKDDEEAQEDEEIKAPEPHEFILKTAEEVGRKLASGHFRNVAVMAGAGISVSAGIPDFRSPGSGLYSRLEQYELPRPEAIFELTYFKRNPEPFFKLAQEYFSDNFKPTPTHYFIRLLQQKNLLMKCYSQNIDGLERKAGVEREKLIQAHGHTESAHCTACGQEYDAEEMKRHISEGTPAYCDCEAPVKPDIVFFGEQLPPDFVPAVELLKRQTDLLIIMGTSLQVVPFSLLADMVGGEVPRILINREPAGGLRYQVKGDTRDVFLQGDCDEIVREICRHAGWLDDFEGLISNN